MSSAVLYQNAEKTVTLLDLPKSIEQGQGSVGHLRSVPILTKPHSSIEPKGHKREKLEQIIPENERAYHRDIQDLIRDALELINSTPGSREWCLPRCEQLPAAFSDSLAQLSYTENVLRLNLNYPSLFLSPLGNVVTEFTSIHDTVVCNPGLSTTLMAGEDSFLIPSQTTFLSSTISRGTTIVFRAIQDFSVCIGEASRLHRFNFLLLDPPWANRSVRHSKSYKTAEDQANDPFDQALPIIQTCLAAEGLVGIWITNKATIRQKVLKSLLNIGLELVEEWVWIKITSEGQPVTELDGIWRKPYEILLLFKRNTLSTPVATRRILIAVPDLHSRKPCLKELIEPFLPQKYQALEIFARSLTSGWWSWGCEALKFQHESQWISSQGESKI